MEEFKFHYEIGDSVGSSDKYFMAHDLDEASNVRVCCMKRKLGAHLTRVEKWNGTNSTWETLEVPPRIRCETRLRPPLHLSAGNRFRTGA